MGRWFREKNRTLDIEQISLSDRGLLVGPLSALVLLVTPRGAL